MRESHVLASEIAVVGNVEVRQHHTLWESRCARGVLHVADIMATHVLLHLSKCLVFNVLSQQQQFGRIIHTAVFLHTDEHHILQIGEPLTIQSTALTGLQFGQHRIGHVHIVAVPSTVGDAERVHIRVFAQIFQLGLFVVGVHGDEHGANLGCGIEECQPIGHVSCPDSYIRTLFHANGKQSFGKIVHALIEFLPSETQVAVAVNDIFFIRSGLGPIFQPLSQCALVQLVALATGLGWVGSIGERSPRHI